jgi:hypothetical protein
MGYYLANNSWVQSSFGTGVASAVVVMLGAMALSACVGILIERFAYRPGRSRVPYTLAFWLGIAGVGVGQLVRRRGRWPERPSASCWRRRVCGPCSRPRGWPS